MRHQFFFLCFDLERAISDRAGRQSFGGRCGESEARASLDPVEHCSVSSSPCELFRS